MTGQPTEVARLPDALVDALPPALASRPRVYAKDLPLELLDAVWNHYLEALTPLHEAGKLGGVLLQYPRWFLPTPANKALLADAASRLAGIPGTVKLRNHHWFDGARATGWTLDMLRDLGRRNWTRRCRSSSRQRRKPRARSCSSTTATAITERPTRAR